MSQYWHIDDSLIGTTSTELSDEFFINYTKYFPMKPLERVTDTVFAGVRMEYDSDEGIMHLMQPHILSTVPLTSSSAAQSSSPTARCRTLTTASLECARSMGCVSPKAKKKLPP